MRTREVVVLVSLLVLALTPPVAVAQGDERLADSSDPTQASVLISSTIFPDAGLDAVVVARNDVFADNLGGAALSGTVRGSLLLTDGGPSAPLRAEVRTELNRVLTPDPGRSCDFFDLNADVFILGGVNAVSADAEQTIRDDGWCVTRLEGDSRIETALAIADTVEERAGTDEILVARADNFADAATGGAYGGFFTSPIVVTPGDSLHPRVFRDIFMRADPFFASIRLLGGTAALSQAVEDELRQQAQDPATSPPSGTTVDRLSGPSRDATGVAIAEAFGQQQGMAPERVAIVNGFTDDAWVYALAGGAISWAQEFPVLYVDTDRIPDATCQYLAAVQPGTIFTVGPTSRVSDATAQQARAIADGTQPCLSAGGPQPTPQPTTSPTPTPTPTPGPPPTGQTTTEIENKTVTISNTGIYREFFEFFAGEQAVIEVRSLGAVDPTVELEDDEENSLGFNDDIDASTTDARLEVTIPADGDYDVVIGDLNGNGGDVQLVITVTS